MKKSNDILIIRATSLSVLVSFIIILAKILAWFYTGSTSVLVSLTDSALDIIASLVNFLAARYALQPPDNEHRFGHGKAEDLAVFAQSSFFAISGIFILILSIKKMIFPEPIDPNDEGIFIMIFSIIMSILLISYQNYAYKRTKSRIVKTDTIHYMSDLLTNSAVIVSLLLSRYFNNIYIDPIFAIFIALYILYSGVKLLIRSFKNLMDHEMDEDQKSKIKEVIMSEKEVRGFHDLKTRYSGRKAVIQVHLEFDGKMTLDNVHKLSDKIEYRLLQIFKNADIIIHQDPYDADEEVQFVS